MVSLPHRSPKFLQPTNSSIISLFNYKLLHLHQEPLLGWMQADRTVGLFSVPSFAGSPSLPEPWVKQDVEFLSLPCSQSSSWIGAGGRDALSSIPGLLSEEHKVWSGRIYLKLFINNGQLLWPSRFTPHLRWEKQFAKSLTFQQSWHQRYRAGKKAAQV